MCSRKKPNFVSYPSYCLDRFRYSDIDKIIAVIQGWTWVGDLISVGHYSSARDSCIRKAALPGNRWDNFQSRMVVRSICKLLWLSYVKSAKEYLWPSLSRRNAPPGMLSMTATGSGWIFLTPGGHSCILNLESSPRPEKCFEIRRHSGIPHKLPFSACGKLSKRDYTTLVHHLERTNPFSTCPFSMTSPRKLLLPARNASSFLNLLNRLKDFSSFNLM